MKIKRSNLVYFVAFVFLLLSVNCSDSDDLIIPKGKDDNKSLVITGAECVFFRAMTGSSEGGVDGLEIDKYRDRHEHKMNSLSFSFNELVEQSSIVFIGNTDSVKINGYIYCGYSTTYPYYGFTYTLRANNKMFKYKFDNNALMISDKPDLNSWVVLGYGNKDKIETYIESKVISTGSSVPCPEFADKFVWEISGNMSFDANISITPEQANKLNERQNWQDFFDEIDANWVYIPAGKYFANKFKTPQDMKYKYEAASWSVYKITYLPEIIEN